MRAYERLLKYVRVYTTSDPNSGTHPSAEREFDLARILVEDMKAIGIEDAFVDEHCYVYGTIPATPGCESKPALGLIAHMDTAPDASGENVNPILHENYDGRDVTLPATGMVMKVSTFPFLKELKGETLITTDGTTLLGADDKAGVSEILTAAETLMAEGRRTVCAPVCDEEYLEKMTPDFWLPDLTDEKKNGWAFYLHYTKDAADGMVGVCHKTGEIGHLFVTEAARGKGYGAKMLDFARKKLPEHDHPTMGVINTNTRAIALYKRMGWRLTGTVLHRYDPAEEGTFAAVYCEELEMQYRG